MAAAWPSDTRGMYLKRAFRFLVLIGCAAVVMAVARPCRAQQQITMAGLKVAVWLPTEKATGADWPVIIFSHGFHGSNIQSTFLMKALADAGYAVFAPNHADAGLGRWKPVVPFASAGQWTDATYADRRRDIEKLIAALKANPRFGSKPYDWDRLGLAGHSLGGYTVLGLAGAWPSWTDNRIKAVLALSPYSAPFIMKKTLGSLHVPVMYQGGTLDFAITPSLRKANGAYDQTPPPKFYIELKGAGHLAWTDLRPAYHSTIVGYSIAFFDHFLKRKPLPNQFAAKNHNIATFRRMDSPTTMPLTSRFPNWPLSDRWFAAVER